jgi:AcrR family transcriptional regulator
MTGKREQILGAALACFTRYGYRRTSMETIAQAAGVSRPALYQHFAGKEHVFRAVVAWLLESALTQAELAHRADGTPADRLYGVLAAKLELVVGNAGQEFRGELLAEAASIASDEVASFQERLIGILEALLRSAAFDLVDVALPARDAAVLLLDAVTGIEQEPAPGETLRTRLRQLVELTVRGLGADRQH